MKDCLSCKIEPFDLKQKIDIFKEGENIGSVECTLDELEKVVYDLCKENSIENVMLNGNALFCMKFSNNLSNYNKNIPINIIFCAS